MYAGMPRLSGAYALGTQPLSREGGGGGGLWCICHNQLGKSWIGTCVQSMCVGMRPLFASHILTVLSQQPLTTRLPSASMTTPKSLLVWPEHVRRHAPLEQGMPTHMLWAHSHFRERVEEEEGCGST